MRIKLRFCDSATAQRWGSGFNNDPHRRNKTDQFGLSGQLLSVFFVEGSRLELSKADPRGASNGAKRLQRCDSLRTTATGGVRSFAAVLQDQGVVVGVNLAMF